MNIILLPIFLVLIGITIVFIVPIIRSRVLGVLSWKKTLILAGLYLGILITLVPILYLLPDEAFIKQVNNKDQSIRTSQNLMNALYSHQIPAEVDLAKMEGIYKNSSNSFKLDSNKLSFNIQVSMGSRHVFVERKPVDDGEIDISTYVTAQYMGEVNFTHQITPPTFTFHNGTLSLIAPGYQTLMFRQFNADFTVDQFKKQNSAIPGMSTNFGGQIIYIRVPKSLLIDGGQYPDQIQMVSSN